jgi:hypothetical protein
MTCALWGADGLSGRQPDHVKRANRGKLIGVKFGADDRVFLLRRTEMKDCAAVEGAVTKPEPGVAPKQR